MDKRTTKELVEEIMREHKEGRGEPTTQERQSKKMLRYKFLSEIYHKVNEWPGSTINDIHLYEYIAHAAEIHGNIYPAFLGDVWLKYNYIGKSAVMTVNGHKLYLKDTLVKCLAEMIQENNYVPSSGS